MIEPSATVEIVAVLSKKIHVQPHEKLCLVLSGGNVDQQKLLELLMD